MPNDASARAISAPVSRSAQPSDIKVCATVGLGPRGQIVEPGAEQARLAAQLGFPIEQIRSHQNFPVRLRKAKTKLSQIGRDVRQRAGDEWPSRGGGFEIGEAEAFLEGREEHGFTRREQFRNDGFERFDTGQDPQTKPGDVVPLRPRREGT